MGVENDDMFAAYFAEKEGKHTFFMEEGFFMFKYLLASNEFWVCFVYIKPEYRNGKTFGLMMDEIKRLGEYSGAKQIIADIDCREKNPESNLQLFLKRGMKIGDIRDNKTIWLYYPLINKNSNQNIKENSNG